MRRKAALVVLLLIGSCGFNKEQFLGDAALPGVKVGFVVEKQVQDESSGAIQVLVRLSRSDTQEITVDYAFSQDGTAEIDQDFTAEPRGTLTFPPNITEAAINLEITIDAIEEENESIILQLSNPVGADLDIARHEVVINRALLPRVNFTSEVSDADEATSLVVTLTLDAPPNLPGTTATIAIKPSSTGVAPYDWTVPSNLTVTFPPNNTSQTITIPIVDDPVDEDPEKLVVEIMASTNVVIGALKQHERTISDNDDPPSVQFNVSAQSNNEGSGNTTINVAVSLSGPSGKTVTVPATFAGGTATENTDYTYISKLALVFSANQNPMLSETTKSFQIQIMGDTTDEENQTIITTLDTPMNASLGVRTTHTYTINNDDMAPAVSFMTASGSAFEGDSGTTPQPYTMVLSQASEKAIAYNIALGQAAGAATIPSDYTTVPAPNVGNTSVTINIAPGSTTAMIVLEIVGDTVAEGMTPETITMTIGAPLVNVRAVGGNAQLQRIHTINDSDM